MTDQFGTVFSATFGIGNGQNFFSALATNGQFITDVNITLNGNVVDIRQFRLGGIDNIADIPVPEPTTWAVMLGGLGLVGAAMRRRRTGTSATVAA